MELILNLLGGLGLFLFGMNFMSQGLQKAAGARLRSILEAMTKNKIVAVLFGALFTAIIQSSGATTVMVVSFVNAGIMTLAQSVGIIFGANIGTTITSQLVAFNLTGVAPFILFVGAVWQEAYGEKDWRSNSWVWRFVYGNQYDERFHDRLKGLSGGTGCAQ